eukprot:5621499-Pleurochrysis_carterae.AAC.1
MPTTVLHLGREVRMEAVRFDCVPDLSVAVEGNLQALGVVAGTARDATQAEDAAQAEATVAAEEAIEELAEELAEATVEEAGATCATTKPAEAVEQLVTEQLVVAAEKVENVEKPSAGKSARSEK